jgi:transitional endoplasmic reticulum ATPase
MFKVQAPSQLPTFADVGGMTSLKELLAETFGLLLSFGDEAESYRITFNGILLHGEPGLGKTFIGKATAGEFALNFLHVTTGQLVSKWLGESAKNIAEAFRVAAANVPCLLFFDEFDSVARRRDDDPDNESRRVVNQLLTSLEEYRTVRELVVMAATNRLEQLDPAVVRPGRFDRHIRVDLPDREARLGILAAQLQRRPTAAGLDLNLLADRTDGLTPATLASIVESAALAAFRESTAVGGQIVPITTELLLAAFTVRQGKDRPAASTYSWDDLVLDQRTKLELQQIQRLIEDPELPRRLGIDPPSGLLLAGLPGTGKTTIARVLAAQAHCSFYAVSAADLTSKWVGESEQRIQSLFSRARDNSPSIVFLDELDAIARKRLGGHDAYDRQLTQLLTEIDGLGSRPGVFVIGATNRPDMLDPAITRGGRLSRTILIPMPNYDARLSILGIHTRRMPLAAVDLQTVARATEGFSGGDLEAVCQQAAIQALVRAGASDVRSRTGESLEVLLEDFAAAVSAIRTTKMFGSVSQPRNG